VFQINSLSKGNVDNLTEDQKETIDAVLQFYGGETAQWLSDLTHMELPWKEARIGIPEGYPCTNEITISSLEEYYSSLPPCEE
jgi:uncharacterized phage-associated protein